MKSRTEIINAIESAADGARVWVLAIPGQNQMADFYMGTFDYKDRFEPRWICGTLHKRGEKTAFLGVPGLCQGLPLTRIYRKPRRSDNQGTFKTALFAFVLDLEVENG